MKTGAKRRLGASLFLAALALGLLGGCATGGLKPTSQESAQVQAVLERWIEALGGRGVLEQLRGMEVRATVELAAGGGANFEVHTWQTAGNFYRSELTFPNGLNLTEAYDGKIAWRKHNALGFGFVPPAELAATLRRDSIRAALTLTEDYPERRLLADATVQGRRCRVVSLTPRAGPPERWFFDEKSGGVLRIERWPAAGAAPDETLEFSDYREVGGMRLPFVLKVQSPTSAYTVRRIEAVPNPLVGNSLWAAPAEALREGLAVAKILDRYRETVGGWAPVERIRSRVTQQEVEITTAGVKYRMTLSQKLPNRVLVEQDLPGMGHVAQGYDGTTAWTNSDLQGYRALKGTELRQLLDNADLRTNTMLAERCPLRRLLGTREVNGRRAQLVALATMQGPAGLYYFGEEDGRLLRIESTVAAGPQGSLAVVFDFADFRAVDGVVMPFTTTATNPAMTSVTKVLSVKHNVPLADALFKPRKDEP